MKKILLLVLALAAMACTPKASQTKLSGSVPSNLASEVSIEIPEIQLDTVLAVGEDGSFSIVLPVSKEVAGLVKIGDVYAQFVPDGTLLSVEWEADPENGFKVVSSSKKGVQSRMNDVNDWMEGFFEAYQTAEDKDAEFDKYLGKLKSIVKENPDNALGIMGITSLRGQIDAPEMMELIGTLTAQLQARPEIVAMKSSLASALQTVAGEMFTDFEVIQPDGSVKKLSDYVGKGKYVLVDFWASWCGPCRREIPNIKAVWEKYHGDKFDVLSVAVWDKPEDTAKALAEEKLPWPQIVNAQRIPTDIYGIEGIPHLILFGPDGRIIQRGEGLRGANMDPVIAGFVK